MNKMQIAHEWAMKHEDSKKYSFLSAEELSSLAWQYADAMQAEADKRVNKERPDVLNMANSPQLDIQELLHSIDNYFDQTECTKTHRMANNLLAEIYEKISSEFSPAESCKEEWQPDWSQAPGEAKYWMITPNGSSDWLSDHPSSDPLKIKAWYAPSFNYQGNWKNSLRERPEALQPEVDWRLAPSWAKFWAIRQDSSDALWCVNKPTVTEDCFLSHGGCGVAPSFGFTGTHIVERPQ